MRFSFSLSSVLKHNLFTNLNSCIQSHASASPHTPHREHRTRDRDHGHRRSRQPLDPASPSSPLVLAPTPAHMKSSSRRVAAAAQQGQADGSRGGSREHISVQPIAPTSRRASQQRLDRGAEQRDRERGERESGGLSAPHPYASPSPGTAGFRSSNVNGAYGRQSPVPPNGQVNGGNGSPNLGTSGADGFLYGGAKVGVAGGSREVVGSGIGVGGIGGRVDQVPNGTRGMNVYERDHLGRVGEQDEDGHGGMRKKSFWGAFCCRG